MENERTIQQNADEFVTALVNTIVNGTVQEVVEKNRNDTLDISNAAINLPLKEMPPEVASYLKDLSEIVKATSMDTRHDLKLAFPPSHFSNTDNPLMLVYKSFYDTVTCLTALIDNEPELREALIKAMADKGYTEENIDEFLKREWDTETGFYYLQSRYYNPEWGRFLNADFAEVVSNENTLTDKNLYAYCDNNPVMRSDADGEFWHLIIGAAVGATVNVVSALMDGKTDATSLIVAGLSGAASGLLTSTGAGPLLQIAGAAAISGIEEYVSQGLEQGFNNVDYSEVGGKAIAGGISGIGTGLDKGTAKHLMTAGKKATKRVANTFKHRGFTTGVREIGSAAKRYFSQSNTLFYHSNIRDNGRDSLRLPQYRPSQPAQT